MNILSELGNFVIRHDKVELSNGKSVYFYRVHPPNLSIMKNDEKETVIRRFQNLLDSVDNRCDFSIFVTDKFENLGDNRDFFANLQIGENLKFMQHELVNLIDLSESEKKSVHRAFYFTVCTEDESVARDFATQLYANDFAFSKTNDHEIANLLRNFFLQEYVDFDLSAFTDRICQMLQKYPDKSDAKYNAALAVTRRLMPRRITFQPTCIQQSDFLRKVIIVKNFPESISSRALLSTLCKLSNTTVSIQLWRMSDNDLNSLVDKQLKNRQSSIFDNKESRSLKASQDYANITNFYQNLTSNSESVYYINIFIELTAIDSASLRELNLRVMSLLGRYGITTEALTFEQKQGFFAINPLHSRRMFAQSANNLPASTLSWLYPFDYSSHNDPCGIPIGNTVDGGDMFIDFLKRDEWVTNGHFIITGETGYGKSHLLKKIISMLYYCGIGVFCLSPNNEYSHMFQTLGGTVIDCSKGNIKINPFDVRRLAEVSVTDESSIESFTKEAQYWQHLSWLRDFYTILFPNIKREELDSLGFFTKRAYEKCLISEYTDFTKLKSSDYPTFSTLYEVISDSYNRQEDCLVSMDVRKSLLLLCDDVANGSLSYIFNGHTNIENADFIVFELQNLLAGSRDRSQAMIFNIMSWIWNRITLRKKHYLFAIDELYMLVNKHNPIIVRYCNEFIKQFRKFRGLMGMATQQVNDVLDSEIIHETASLFNAPAHKFLLNPGQLDIHELIRILQLSGGEIDCMENLRRGQCLYKRANEASYHVNIDKLSYEDKLFGNGGDG